MATALTTKADDIDDDDVGDAFGVTLMVMVWRY